MWSVEEAQKAILMHAKASAPERVALLDAFGRHLATNLAARRALPPFANSAMDGYAVRAEDLIGASKERPVALRVAHHIGAGNGAEFAVSSGFCARIMTGAKVPSGADAIVMREETDESNAHANSDGSPGKTLFFSQPKAGTWIRNRGEDIAEGAPLLPRGAPIGPGEIGLLAAQGITSMLVYQRPRVALLATGDELVEPDEAPAQAQIVNSNAWALAAQIAAAGAVPHILPIARDSEADLAEKLAHGLKADLLLTIGGVSVGDHDLVRAALERAGVTLEFWKVAMKPGKPVAFGLAPGGQLCFGLPGNPASSMVCFELFVRPALRQIVGDPSPFRSTVEVEIDQPVRKEVGRRHYLRAQIRSDAGSLRAKLLGRQGSGMLSSMVNVNALVTIGEEISELPAGARATALLIGELQ